MSAQRIGTWTVCRTRPACRMPRCRRVRGCSLLDERPGVVRHRALVAREVRGQGGERVENGLALAAGVDQGEGEEGADGVVERVAAAAQLGLEQGEAGGGLAEVAQRAGELDHRAPSPLAVEAELERVPVQRHGEDGGPGGVAGRRTLERAGSVVVELAGQRVDRRDELVLRPIVQRGPEGGQPSLPLLVRHAVSLSTGPDAPTAGRSTY